MIVPGRIESGDVFICKRGLSWVKSMMISILVDASRREAGPSYVALF